MQNFFAKGITLKLILMCTVSLLIIWFLPSLDKSVFPYNTMPGSLTLLGIGLVITLFTALILYSGIKSQLNMPKKFVLYALLYNILIIVVKFVLSPLSVYRANQSRTFDFDINGNYFTLFLITAIIFLLYFTVFSLIYLYFKRKVKRTISINTASPIQKTKTHKWFVFVGLALLFGVIILTGGGIIFFFPLIFSMFSFEYLTFVFSTIFGFLIALALIGAIYFVTGAFNSVAERSIALRDVTVLASFFWVGVSFLFIYHALWVVYMIMLTTVWPLRVVIPK